MSDVPLETAGQSPEESGLGAGEGAWDEFDTLPVEDVRELFVTLGKALRAYQLYDENNPVYKRFVSSLVDAFTPIWEELDRLTVQVTEDALVLGREEVYRNESKGDSIAFLFFKDGVREITFLPGVEDEELTRLLGVLQHARNVRQEGDDLLTILWEADLAFFRYHHIDVLAEGVEVPEGGPGHEQGELQAVLEAETEEGSEESKEAAQEDGAPDGPKPFSREDFNPTLYSLDAREMDQLRKEIDREMERDLRTEVLAALFDRLEEPDYPERQSEILGIFRQLLPNFLSRGALASSSSVLRQLSELRERGDVFDPTREGEAEQLLAEVSSVETIEELVRALEDGSIRASVGELTDFMSHLRSSALAPLLRAAETTEVKELQPVLRRAVVGIAERSRQTVAVLLDHADPVVVAGAARLAGRMQMTEVGSALGDLTGHPDPEVRLAAVEAARDLKASTAAGALVGLLFDEEREVRVAGARALGQLRYRPSAGHFRDIVEGKEIRDADLSEKIAFFESFGMVAEDEAVPVLGKLLNGRSFFGRREPSEIRACSALALGKIGTADARAALRAASEEDDPVVRSAVNRALRGEE